MRCPRCETEVLAAVASCPRCAAPLLLGEEPAPSALDGVLRLDRRGRSRDQAAEEGRQAAATRELVRDLGLDPDLGLAQHLGPHQSLDLDHGLDLDLDHGLDLDLELDHGLDHEPDHAIDRGPGPGRDLAGAEVEERTLEIHLERAPLSRRLAAAAVDAAVLAVFAGPPLALAARGLPAGADPVALVPAAAGLVAFVAFAHAAVGHALLGATIGKLLLGLRVAGPDGAAPSPSRSAVRALVALAGAAPLGLGPAVALFTRSGQALHDLAARTVVVRAP